MPEVFIRVQTTAGQQGIGDADSGGAAECRAGVKRIIPLQERAVNDTEDIRLIAVPIFLCQPGCDVFQLRREAIPAGDLKAALQRRTHHLAMLWPVLPEVGIQAVVHTARVRYIKHISQYRSALAGVDQRDALGPPAHIAAHGLVPQVVLGAGRGVRALLVDHELLVVGIFLKMLSRGNVSR